MTSSKNSKTCELGHTFEKSSDCPVCPKCEELRKPFEGFLSTLGAPARRALENEGITTLEQLARYSKKELLSLHGMGKSTIPKLQSALQTVQLDFRS